MRFYFARKIWGKNGHLSGIKYAMHFVDASTMRFAESICFDKFLRCAHNSMRVWLRRIERVIILLSLPRTVISYTEFCFSEVLKYCYIQWNRVRSFDAVMLFRVL